MGVRDKRRLIHLSPVQILLHQYHNVILCRPTGQRGERPVVDDLAGRGHADRHAHQPHRGGQGQLAPPPISVTLQLNHAVLLEREEI